MPRSDVFWDESGPEYEPEEPRLESLGGLTIKEYEAETNRIRRVLDLQFEGMRMVLNALHELRDIKP